MKNTFQENLRKTLKEFGIQARWVANTTQSDEGNLSKYLNGVKDCQTDTLEKWVKVLPVEAQQRFYENCLSETVTSKADLVALIEKLDPASQEDREKAAEALTLLGRFYRRQAEVRENTDTTTEKELLRSL